MADICKNCKFKSYISIYCPARICDIMFDSITQAVIDCDHYVKDDNLVSRKSGYTKAATVV